MQTNHKLVSWSTKKVLSWFELEQLAVCSNSRFDCKWPMVRLMDGGYTDNSGIPALIARLQETHPCGRVRGSREPCPVLRLAAVNADICEAKKDGIALSNATFFEVSPAACAESINFGIKHLFTQNKPGQPLHGAHIEDLPTKTVFRETWASQPGVKEHNTIFGIPVPDDEQSNEDTPPSQGGKPKKVSKPGKGDKPLGQSYHRGRYTTVENRHFGVKAGWTVELLVLNINSPCATAVFRRKNAECFRRLAEQTYRAAAPLLRTFFPTSCVPNGKAVCLKGWRCSKKGTCVKIDYKRSSKIGRNRG